MGKDSKTGSSFYKILFNPHFTSQLRLPAEFVKDHGKKLSEKVKIVIGDECGDSSWVVGTEQIGSHTFFTDGWSRFAQDADLKPMQFLIFKLIGKSKFEVSVYEKNACIKEFHSPREIKREYEFDETHVSGNGQNWSFVEILTGAHISELEIPRDFAVGTGIVGNMKLKLQIGEGKKWPIYVKARKRGKFAMTAGWNEFLRGNKVVIGSTISFEFPGCSSGNVIAAKVVKKETRKGELLFRVAKRKRGRPPNLDGF